jgi:SAM-dependent methyltransferase
MDEGHIERERDHWDHAIPTLGELLAQYNEGPDPNTARMLDAVRPGPGRHILDFACGGGVTSAWLAARGATVTGIDLSPRSIEVAEQLAQHLNLGVRWLVADLEQHVLPGQGYDGMVGRYALHHLDVPSLAPALAATVRPGEVAAFVETMDTNPVLRFARAHLVGRFGIPRYGTIDEHPLVDSDLAALRDAFGSLKLATESFHFLELFDRQILKYRSQRASSVIKALDEKIKNTSLGERWGYHQVLIARRAAAVA